jgi:hypothetical protein
MRLSVEYSTGIILVLLIIYCNITFFNPREENKLQLVEDKA